MVGTTRPRVNLFMNRFRKKGFINYDGGLEVHQSLRKFSGPLGVTESLESNGRVGLAACMAIAAAVSIRHVQYCTGGRIDATLTHHGRRQLFDVPRRSARSLQKAKSKNPCAFDVKLFLDSAGLGERSASFEEKKPSSRRAIPRRMSCTFRKAA